MTLYIWFCSRNMPFSPFRSILLAVPCPFIEWEMRFLSNLVLKKCALCALSVKAICLAVQALWHTYYLIPASMPWASSCRSLAVAGCDPTHWACGGSKALVSGPAANRRGGQQQYASTGRRQGLPPPLRLSPPGGPDHSVE